MGRLYLNLTKTDGARWKKFAMQEKKSNIGVWWELHEKYEDELEKHSPADDEEEVEEPTKKKKKSKFHYSNKYFYRKKQKIIRQRRIMMTRF